MVKRQVDHVIFFSISFILTIIAIYIRYREPLINPHFYTEDATWFSLLFYENFIDALLKAKEQYFVLGNLLILKIALEVNNWFFSNDILQLPRVLYWVSVFFMLLF